MSGRSKSSSAFDVSQKFVAPPFPQHADCFVCGTENPHGLQVNFKRLADGSIRGTTSCDPAYQSFDGVLHGGIIASLLDGAMTHCLLTRSIRALTAKLSIRYLQAVKPAAELSVTAAIIRERGIYFELAAALFQKDKLCARATGKFINTKTN